jgi:hypothetical protein
MNSPPFLIRDPPHTTALEASVVHENLVKRLQVECLEETPEERTPEPQSPVDTEECHQWRCEELLKHFKPYEADKY